MFGFGKKKLFEQHQRNLLTCLLFGEFALNSAEESANSDQIEFWETEIPPCGINQSVMHHSAQITPISSELISDRLQRALGRGR